MVPLRILQKYFKKQPDTSDDLRMKSVEPKDEKTKKREKLKALDR